MPAITKKATRLRLEFVSNTDHTIHAGLVAVEAMARRFGLWEKLRGLRCLDPRKDRKRGYGPEVLVGQLIYALCSGGGCLSDSEALNDDPLARELFGVKKFADQTQVGQWLREQTEASVVGLRKLLQEFVVAQTYSYNTSMALYPVAHLLAAMAVVLSARATLRHVALAALLYVAPFSIYQSVAANAATIFVVWLLCRIMFGGPDEAFSFREAGRATIAVFLGDVLASAGMAVIGFHPAVSSLAVRAGFGAIGLDPHAVALVAGILVFAVGEMIYSAHFYRYLGSIAPPDQIGMYMGFAFLPCMSWPGAPAHGSFLPAARRARGIRPARYRFSFFSSPTVRSRSRLTSSS